MCLLALASCSKKMLSSFVGRPNIYYEQDAKQMIFVVDSVKQFNLFCCIYGKHKNSRANIFVDKKYNIPNIDNQQLKCFASEVRRYKVTPVGYGNFEYSLVFGCDTIPVIPNNEYYIYIPNK